jgi:transcriptional regulator GlxA family with amidase domain
LGSRHGERLQLQLLAHFGLERLRQEHERQSEAAAARAGGSAKLAEAVALMQANLGEPLSTEDIAGLVGVSRRQLERLFRQHLDTLPSRWYLEQRLQRAQRLLQQSSQSILQVGLGCGFTSGAHFSNAYRGFFGRTPRDERSARAAAWRQNPLAGSSATGESPHSAKERT